MEKNLNWLSLLPCVLHLCLDLYVEAMDLNSSPRHYGDILLSIRMEPIDLEPWKGMILNASDATMCSLGQKNREIKISYRA